MKRLILIFLLSIGTFRLLQPRTVVVYVYDEAGNRVERTTTAESSIRTTESSSRVAASSSKITESSNRTTESSSSNKS